MATVVVQYVVHGEAASRWLPESNRSASVHCFVTAIRSPNDNWGALDRDASLFSFVTRDLTTAQQAELLIGKKAINRMNPSGPLLPVSVADQRNVERLSVSPN